MRLILALLLTSIAHAQTWYTIAAQGATLTLPVGSVVRYGDTTNNLWSAPVTVVKNPVAVNSIAFIDPDPAVKIKFLQLRIWTSADAPILPANTCKYSITDGTLTVTLGGL